MKARCGLVGYRQQLVNERRAAKLRIRALLREERIPSPACLPWGRRWMQWVRSCQRLSEQARWVLDQHLDRLEALEKAILEVECRLATMTAREPVVHRLRSFRGIGPVTAWMLRAEIGRFDRFRTGKQLARFCGLSPRNASSGMRQADAGLIKAGNPYLRAVLMEAAHRLIRHDDYWGALPEKPLDAGKRKCVVVPAVGNRWLRWLFHRMQDAAAAA